MVILNFWHLNVLNDTLACVSSHFGGVDLDLETEGALHLGDLEELRVVELGHAFDFDEFHEVALLEGVALIFVNSDKGFFFLTN